MTDPKRIASLHKQGGVYKPMSEITPGTQDVLDSPTPAWLDREYPYVAPPGEGCTLRELDYLTSLIPLRAQWGSFIKAADEDMAGLFVTLCSELGAPCDRQALNAMAGQAAVLITKMKWLYNRPRPYQTAAKHNRLAGQGRVTKPGDFWPMDTKTAHTPSYPSGHTIQAYLLASRLSEVAPQHRKAFMDLAHAISFSRAVGGYHWPSDLTFAKDVFRHIVSPHMPSSIRVAAKYKDKKEVPKSDGKGTTTVYEYGPRQVAKRHKDKAVRIEALRKKMGDLRQKARADLTASDPETRLTALAVCLMDETYERVGNEQSAEDGHYGVTNWTADHITLSDKAATIRYTGKSGVKHEKKVTNARVLSALRKAVKGKGKGDKVLCDGDECSILAKDVNAYLKPYGITAKDIRGLHANEEMKHHLKAQRKAGPADLPHSRKEKDEILKAEFQAALDLAAAAVGHEPSTLRSQYLVPNMEDSYVHDGTVLDRLDKVATLSDTEREDREAERLVKKSPKKKPPRLDRERRIVQDKDNTRDPDKVQDDKDTSNRSRDAAARVALRHMLSRDTRREVKEVGDVWETGDGKWSAKGKDETRSGFESEDSARAWVSGGSGDAAPDEGGDAPSAGAAREEAEKKQRETASRIDEVQAARSEIKSLTEGDPAKWDRTALQAAVKKEFDAMGLEYDDDDIDILSIADDAQEVKDAIDNTKKKSAKNRGIVAGFDKDQSDLREAATKAIQDVAGKQDIPSETPASMLLDVAKAVAEGKGQIMETLSSGDRDGIRSQAEEADKVLKAIGGKKPPTADAVAKALLTKRAVELLGDPTLIIPTKPLTSYSLKPLSTDTLQSDEHLRRMAGKTVSFVNAYRGMGAEDRDAHSKALVSMMDKLDDNGQSASEQYSVALAQSRALAVASALADGDEAKGITPEFQAMLSAADNQGRLEDFLTLNFTGKAEKDKNAQAAYREIIRDVPFDQLGDFLAEDDPRREAISEAQKYFKPPSEAGAADWSSVIDQETRDEMRKDIEDLILSGIAFTDMDEVRKGGKSTGKQKKDREAKGEYPEAQKSIMDKIAEAVAEIKRKIAEATGTSSKTASLPTGHYDFTGWGDVLSSPR